jgi:glycosyltransferase involved in cell wall biosynthesis
VRVLILEELRIPRARIKHASGLAKAGRAYSRRQLFANADIEAHGVGDRVAVLGAVPPERIVELFLESDLFGLASRFEGYGMALTEAIAHGIPVMSTLAGAIPKQCLRGPKDTGESASSSKPNIQVRSRSKMTRFVG